MSIGNILRQKRKDSGYTLNDIANHLGIDISLVSRYENGTRHPSNKCVSEMCKFYGVSKEDIDEIQIMHLTDSIITLFGDNKYLLDAMKRAASIIKQKKS